MVHVALDGRARRWPDKVQRPGSVLLREEGAAASKVLLQPRREPGLHLDAHVEARVRAVKDIYAVPEPRVVGQAELRHGPALPYRMGRHLVRCRRSAGEAHQRHTVEKAKVGDAEEGWRDACNPGRAEYSIMHVCQSL